MNVDYMMYFATSRKPEPTTATQIETEASFNIADKSEKSAAKEDLGLIPNVKMTQQAAPVEDKIETVPVKDMFITIAGSPGAGKSTQGKMLSARYGIPHISVGKLLRQEIADKTTLGLLVESCVREGNLAPSNLVGAVVKNRLSQPDCKNGFILDGYPRRMEDLKEFEGMTKELGINNFRMIGIQVKPDTVIERLKYRRVCDNGHSYDLRQSPPKKPGVCDIDGLKLHQRSDDKPETIRHRFQVYHQETIPVINYYKKKGNYQEVEGNTGIDQVNSRLTEILDPKEENPTNKKAGK